VIKGQGQLGNQRIVGEKPDSENVPYIIFDVPTICWPCRALIVTVNPLTPFFCPSQEMTSKTIAAREAGKRLPGRPSR
jgi:hypothetical protein